MMAIRMGIGFAWPYLRMAKYYLERKDYLKCIEVCRGGIHNSGLSSQTKSNLMNLMAIFITVLESPFHPDAVHYFDLAIETDPGNEIAKFNRTIYEMVRDIEPEKETGSLPSWKGLSED